MPSHNLVSQINHAMQGRVPDYSASIRKAVNQPAKSENECVRRLLFWIMVYLVTGHKRQVVIARTTMKQKRSLPYLVDEQIERVSTKNFEVSVQEVGGHEIYWRMTS